MKTIAIIIMLIGTTQAQNIYELQPGTKGNEIKLTVANVSETNAASNITIRPHPTLSEGEGFQEETITFHQLEKTIDILSPKEEKEITFTFDINRNAPINRRDTIGFLITSPDGIMMMKQFIFSYTGPKEFKLEQNFPNPFNPSTVISYQLPVISKTTLKVYDILGSEIATLVNEEQVAGYYEVRFNGSNLASGMYVYRIETPQFTSERNLCL